MLCVDMSGWASPMSCIGVSGWAILFVFRGGGWSHPVLYVGGEWSHPVLSVDVAGLARSEPFL